MIYIGRGKKVPSQQQPKNTEVTVMQLPTGFCIIIRMRKNVLTIPIWERGIRCRPNRLSTYLGKITRNLALNRYKRYTAEKRGGGQVESVLSELEDCIPAAGSVEQAAEDEVLVSVINRFLQTQPREKRNIFIRRYWHLWPVRNIADAYGMSESKVTSMLFRMRGELRRCLEQEDIVL